MRTLRKLPTMAPKTPATTENKQIGKLIYGFSIQHKKP